MAFNPLALAGGLAQAALPLGAAALGIGKNTTNVTDFGRTSQYNPNAYQYGGAQGMADQTANRFSGLAGQAQGRNAFTPQYQRANDWEQQALASRAEQGQMAGLMHARATGAVPSIAGQQAALDMQRAGAAQSSAMASARGAGGLALAGQNAANNTATMQSAISNQAQINAANERMQAEQAAYGAYAGMRQGDAAAQGLAAQQAQYTAGLQQQNRAQNDQYSMGLYGQEAGVRNAQLTGGMNQQATLANSFGQGQGQRLAQGSYNADREYDYYNQFGKGLTGAMGASGFGSPGGGEGAAGGSNAQMASSAVTGTGPMSTPNTNMAIAPPGPTSDDRAKFGMSPLSMLGMLGGGGGSSSPTGTVDIGGKGYMSSDDIQRGATGLAGQTMPGMVGGGGVTGGAVDMGQDGGGGGMGGGMGLLSDDHAKLRATYLQGIADGQGEGRSYPALAGNEELIVGRDGARIQSGFAGARAQGGAMTDRELAARDSDAAARESERDGPVMNAASFLTGAGPALTGMASTAGLINRGQAVAERYTGAGVPSDVRGSGTMRSPQRFDPTDAAGGQRYANGDPVTEQFARGLAPIRFEYRPGMGPEGQQTGVRAQQAETQPVTASMITRRPDGLRQIDPAMGLGTALAGVGHLAQKQRQQEAQLNELLGLSARRAGY